MTPDVIKVLATPETEPGLFMRAHVAHGTVVWTEEIDLSPDTLYLRGQVA